MKILLIIVTSVGLLGTIGSTPSEQQHRMIFPETDEDIPVFIAKPAIATNQKRSLNIKFPDTETSIEQNTENYGIDEDIEIVLGTIEEKYESPLRPLFLELYKNKNYTSEYKTLTRTSKSVIYFFENFLFGIDLQRLGPNALKTAAG